jgi:recombination protein RecR
MGPINRLIGALKKLPGIGEKSAARLAYHIMRAPRDEAMRLASSIIEVKEKISLCPECFNLTEEKNCPTCTDPQRDKTTVCIVEDPQDAQAIEATGSFRGVYHVLHGALSPLDGIGPDDLKANELLTRIKRQSVKEVIIATNPTTAGEATAIYITRLARPLGIKISRIAFGIPFGGDIEYADRSTLARSIETRTVI